MSKTIKVERIKELVNNFNLHSSDDFKFQRNGQNMLLSTILMETNNYKGFNYLTKEQMKESQNGNSFGVNYENGIPCIDYNERFKDTDETRVYFY